MGEPGWVKNKRRTKARRGKGGKTSKGGAREGKKMARKDWESNAQHSKKKEKRGCRLEA